MVKVEVEAHELRNGEIEKLSLVTHGAIRQPFKILKTEEISQESTQTMGEKISKFFSGNTEEGAAQVAAVYVRKGSAAQWLPLIRKNGFRVEKEHAALENDVLILKQEGYDEEAAGSVVALTPDVAVQLDRVVKYFDPYPESANFDENIKAAGFYPGLNNALSTLADTVWNVLNGVEDTDEASAAIAKQVKAFGVHVNALVAELPTAVFKMEQEWLTKEFEGSTVSTSDTTNTLQDEESNMSGTPVLKEAASGDLDGLLEDAPAADAAVKKADDAAEDAEVVEAPVQFFKGEEQLSKEAFEALADEDEVIVKQEGEDDKTLTKAAIVKGDEGAPKTGGSPGNPVVENTSDTGAVQLDEGGVPAGFRKEERIVKELVEGKLVEKTQLWFINDDKEEIFGGYVEKADPEADAAAATAAADNTEYTPAEIKLFEAMGVMVKAVTEVKDLVTKQGERIDAVEKTADTAQETADNTVVLPTAADDLGNAIATLSGQRGIVKEAAPAAIEKEDVFKGLLPGIEGNAA